MSALPPKIAIFEDEPDIVELIELELEPLSTDTCSWDGEENPVSFIKKFGPIDLVVCDIRMPKWNGFDILKSFRESDIIIPFLFISGDTLIKTDNEWYKDPLVFFLAKPWGYDELLHQCQHVLDQTKLSSKASS